MSRLGPHPARQSAREGVLVSCPFFTTHKLRVAGTVSFKAKMIALLDGNLEIDGRSAQAGEVWYSDADNVALELRGDGTVLLAS